MTDTPIIDRVYERYAAERSEAELNRARFERLLTIFPAVLIAQADGHIDTTELIHLSKLVKFLTEDSQEDEEFIRKEIRYLTWNGKAWRGALLEALRELIHVRRNGDQVLDLMISSASSSTGSLITNILLQATNPSAAGASVGQKGGEPVEFISPEEKQEIMLIVRALGMWDDPQLAAKIERLVN